MGVLIYAIAALFLIFEMALQVSPSVMTADLMRAFDIGAGKLGLMAGFYFYSYTLMQIPAGLITDRYGPRRVLTAAAILCALGAYFFAGTETFLTASLGRFLMGLGSSAAFICVLIVASRWFKKRVYTLLVGITMFLAAMGALSGALVLSFFTDLFGWREVILVLGLSCLGVALIAVVFVRDYPKGVTPHHKTDNHLRLAHKLHEILTQGQTYAIAGYAFCSWAPVAVFAALWGVPFVMELHQVDNTQAAIAVGMTWLGVGCVSPFLGWFSEKIGLRNLPLQLTAILGVISSVCVIYIAMPFWLTCVMLFCLGVAGSGQIVTFGILSDINRPSMTGAAVGLNNMALVSGGAILQPVIGWLLAILWEGGTRGDIPFYSVSNYQLALIIVPICFIGGWVLSTFFIRETYCKHKER